MEKFLPSNLLLLGDNTHHSVNFIDQRAFEIEEE
jgi:hypothetical protein